MSEQESFFIRLPLALKAALEQRSKAEERSLAGTVRKIVREALEAKPEVRS